MPNSADDPKPALNRHRILAEAVALADVEGVDALSMRKLAERLGVGAMSLYRHVDNKDDMIAAMIDVVCADIERPKVGGDWRESIMASSASAHRAMLEHRWVAGQWSMRRPGANRTAYMEALLAVLTEAGLADDLVYRGYHAVTMHIVGFTIQELSFEASSDMDLDAMAEDFLTGLVDADLPHLAEHVRAHMAVEGHGDEFGFVLGLILDGLERANNR